MTTTFLPYLPDQDLLLPASLTEWPPEDHLAYFIGDAIHALGLDGFYARYAGDGRRGLAAAQAEWNLVRVAVNLKRMHRLGWNPA